MVKLLNPQQEGSLVSIRLLDCPPELMLPCTEPTEGHPDGQKEFSSSTFLHPLTRIWGPGVSNRLPFTPFPTLLARPR